ncbi:MAG: hypothetical protein EHM45_16475, partial [Desulfobacteraceae bacterium]
MLKSFIQHRIFWIMALAFLFISFSTCYAAQNITVALSAQPAAFNGQCPALIKFNGRISVTEPTKIQYQFVRNDGVTSGQETLVFIKPGSHEVSATCTLEGSTPAVYQGWAYIKITGPQVILSNRASFKVQCAENVRTPSPAPVTRAPATGSLKIVKPWVLSGINPQPEPPGVDSKQGLTWLNPQPEPPAPKNNTITDPPKPALNPPSTNPQSMIGPAGQSQTPNATGSGPKQPVQAKPMAVQPFARLIAPEEGAVWETGGIYSVEWSSFNITPGSHGTIVCQRLPQASSSGNAMSDFYNSLNNSLENLPFIKVVADNIAPSGKVSFRTVRAAELDLKKFPIGSLVDMVITLSFLDKKTNIRYEDSRVFKLRITDAKGSPAQTMAGNNTVQSPVTQSPAVTKAMADKNKIVQKDAYPQPAAYFLEPQGTVEWAPGSTHTISWACNLPANQIKNGEIRIDCPIPKMPGQGPRRCDYFSSTILKSAASEGEITYTVPSYPLYPNEKIILALFLKLETTP